MRGLWYLEEKGKREGKREGGEGEEQGEGVLFFIHIMFSYETYFHLISYCFLF